MLKDINDRPTDAEALVQFCRELNVQVNLIPYNSIESQQNLDRSSMRLLTLNDAGLQSTDLNEVYAIANYLRDNGLVVRVRNSFGGLDNAACGQLALSNARTKV